jgi:NAD(P)-dependent dehydrogenase (short-subunit alcohol dehydrogenase family)
VIGAGDATGSAVARRFAKEGYTVCAARRTATALKPLVDQITVEGGKAVAFGLDARREDQVVNFFQHIEAEVGPVEVLVFNVGGNVRFPVLETTAQKYFKTWEMCAMAGFLVGREAARVMLPRQRGTVLFTGATASLRGGVGFSAFAGGGSLSEERERFERTIARRDKVYGLLDRTAWRWSEAVERMHEQQDPPPPEPPPG